MTTHPQVLGAAMMAGLLLIVACQEPVQAAAPAPQASEGEPAPAPPIAPLPEIGPKAQTVSKTQIDWPSARADMQASNDGSVRIQTVNEAPAAVPVLVPTGIVIAQNAESGPVYRRTPDGYFAFYPGEAYNIIVNGTNQTVIADAIPKTNAARAPVFSTNAAGAQVWLTRYGADYTIEFECNAIEDENATCIEEADAMEIAQNLIVTGSR